MRVIGTYCALKARCAILYSFFLLCPPLCLYVIWPASHPWGAYPIRLAVLQCVPTDLMWSEWLTGLSLLPALFSPPCFAHTCAEETHNLMQADWILHLPWKSYSRSTCNYLLHVQPPKCARHCGSSVRHLTPAIWSLILSVGFATDNSSVEHGYVLHFYF